MRIAVVGLSVLAGILTVGLFFMYQQRAGDQMVIAGLQQELAEANEKLAKAQARPAPRVEPRRAPQATQVAPTGETPAHANSPGEMKNLLDRMLQQPNGGAAEQSAQPDTPAPASAPAAAPLRPAYTGPVDPNVAAVVDADYGALFDHMNLAPEVRTAAMAAIRDEINQATANARAYDENAGIEKNLRAIHDRMQSILPADAMGQFDAYQADMPARESTSVVMGSIEQLGGNLPPASREHVQEVFYQQFRGVSSSFNATRDLNAYEQMLAGAYNGALAQLQNELPADQYAAVEAAVQQQRAQQAARGPAQPQPQPEPAPADADGNE